MKDSSIVNDMINKIEIDTIFQENIDGITQCAKQADLSVGNTVAWLYREVDAICEIQKKRIKPDKKIESRKEQSEKRRIRMKTFDKEIKSCNCTKLDCKSKFSSDDQKKLRSQYWNKESMEEKNMFLNSLMCQKPKTTSTNISNRKKNRQYTIEYFLPVQLMAMKVKSAVVTK